MSTIEERTAYLNNPFFTKHLYGDFSPFYITIAICTILGFTLFILNIIVGCCSKHRDYWQDRHTGNRWLVSIWTATPHKQPPLDLTELQDVKSFAPPPANTEYDPREYELLSQRQQQAIRSYPEYQPHQQRHQEEYVELQKRESDI